jgi:tRNA(fMet)-specific endonuclease VapC
MLETSVCVSLIQGRASAVRLPAASEGVLSTIIVAELEVGVRRSVRPAAQRKAVDAFTGIFEVLAWDLQATSYYGALRVDLEKRGIVIGPLDMFIAAHALGLGATLVTANFREFRRVADLQCLEWKLSGADAKL